MKHNSFWHNIGKGIHWIGDHTIGKDSIPAHLITSIDHSFNHVVSATESVAGKVVDTGGNVAGKVVTGYTDVAKTAIPVVGNVFTHGEDALKGVFSSPLLIGGLLIGAYIMLKK